MCRLVGIVAASPYEFGHVLRDAPRSMAMLSREHRDGWGLATHQGVLGEGWMVRRSVLTAGDDPLFLSCARRARGRMMLAHVRQKTIGPLAVENTHPFRHGRWAFAHNGTIKDVAFVSARASPERLAEREGVTDSELFFAYLLTKLDEAGVTDDVPATRTDEVVRRAVHAAIEHTELGTANFLLSNGLSLYAHRLGRPLHLLERAPVHPEGEYPLDHRSCVVVASEPLTDERWTDLPQGSLLRVDLAPSPRWNLLQ